MKSSDFEFILEIENLTLDILKNAVIFGGGKGNG